MAKRKNQEDETQAQEYAGEDTAQHTDPAATPEAETEDEDVPPGHLKMSIKEHVFIIPFKFSPGHALSELEAKFLSSKWADAARNTFYDTLKTMEAQGAGPEEIRSAFLVSLDEYVPYTRIGAARVSPEEALANEMAWAEIRAALAKRNIVASNIKQSKRTELIAARRAAAVTKLGSDPYLARAQEQLAAADQLDVDLSLLDNQA